VLIIDNKKEKNKKKKEKKKIGLENLYDFNT
jgi:hypothetical protein